MCFRNENRRYNQVKIEQTNVSLLHFFMFVETKTQKN